MFDSHCHLQFEAFDHDRDEVLRRSVEAGLNGILLADYDSTRRDLLQELTRIEGLFATAGLHPWAVASYDDAALRKELERLGEALDSGVFCGVGELGLDFYRCKDEAGRALQERAFVAQLGMAREKNLPVVIHAVKCHNTLIKVLRREGLPQRGGFLHGYSGSPRQAGTFLMMNLDLSIGTPLTFGNPSAKLQEVVRQIPLDRLLVETDAPDRPPGGYHGERNEPPYLNVVIQAVARLKGERPERIAAQGEQNIRDRFSLGEECLRLH